MEQAKTIVKNLKKAYSHLESEGVFKQYNESVYFIFDKNFEVYILEDYNYEIKSSPLRVAPESYGLFYFNDKDYDYSLCEKAAEILFTFKKGHVYLDILEVLSKKFARKNLGKALLEFMSYYIDQQGEYMIKGKAFPINEQIIDFNKLKNFYKSVEFNVSKDGKFKKYLYSEDMKTLSDRVITMKDKNNQSFKVILPPNTKQKVLNILKSEQNINSKHPLEFSDNNKITTNLRKDNYATIQF